MWRGPKRLWASGLLAVVFIVVAVIAWDAPTSTTAQVGNCGGAVEIVNGGFESPNIPLGGSREVAPDGWASTGTVFMWGEGNRTDNATQFASLFRNATLSQTIHQSELAGSTVTITFAASGASTTLLVMFQNTDQRVLVDSGFATHTVTVEVSADDPGPYFLSFAGITPNPVDVDNVAVNFAKTCPTPRPTRTPLPKPTTVPTETPGEEVEITVTGDPRYPIPGSVTLDIPGLSYSLVNKPDEGRVIVELDGTFTYTASSRWVMFDQFIVLASNSTMITVNVVLQIDPPLPSFGQLGVGDTRTDDPTPQPTSIPDSDDKCSRCN